MEDTEIITTTSDGMTYRKIDGKVVSRQDICHVREYKISKHVTSLLPEALLLDEPAYRVSRNNSLMTHVDFPDLDTAIEYALGLFIKDTVQEVQAGFNCIWNETLDNLATKTVSVSLDGVISYGEGRD